MTSLFPYVPPIAESTALSLRDLLAQSPGYNPDNNSEYFDEEYGGNL